MTSFSESRAVRVSNFQQQLRQIQEELRKEKESKLRAHAELMESDVFEQNESEGKSKVEILQKEIDRVKESEQKMLDSLILQTKVLEQTKIALEEAKLEISSLQESNRSVGRSISATWSSRNLEKYLFRHGLFLCPDNEISMLQNELKLAMEAESKSKKDMDDMSISLKEVMTEANLAKQNLSATQSELEKVKAELDQLRTLVKSTEDKSQISMKESERLKLELEHFVAFLNTKEKEFSNFMKMSVDEIAKLKKDNVMLLDIQKLTSEENSMLRELLKQSVYEASVTKEKLEISKEDNAQLQDLLSYKENDFQSLKQQLEYFKVSEAAANDSVQQLKNLLATTAKDWIKKSINSSDVSHPVENEPVTETKTVSNSIVMDATVKDFSSGIWINCKPGIQNGRRHSIGGSMFSGFVSEMEGSTIEKDQISATFSNVTEMKVSSLVAYDTDDDFNHIDANKFENIEQTLSKQKKKRPMLRRFGDMFRRKDSQRQNSTLAI